MPNQYHHKYTGCHLLTAIAWWEYRTIEWIAGEIGVKPDALRKRVSLWRSEGKPIAMNKKKPVGSTIMKFRGGRWVEFVKCADRRWRVKNAMSRDEAMKVAQSLRHVKGRESVAKKPTPQRTKAALPKRVEKVFPTLQRDLSEMVHWKVPGMKNTHIQVPVNSTEEERMKKAEKLFARRA